MLQGTVTDGLNTCSDKLKMFDIFEGGKIHTYVKFGIDCFKHEDSDTFRAVL